MSFTLKVHSHKPMHFLHECPFLLAEVSAENTHLKYVHLDSFRCVCKALLLFKWLATHLRVMCWGAFMRKICRSVWPEVPDFFFFFSSKRSAHFHSCMYEPIDYYSALKCTQNYVQYVSKHNIFLPFFKSALKEKSLSPFDLNIS